MNKILIEDTKLNKDLCLNDDAIVIIKNSEGNVNFSIKSNLNVLTIIVSSKITITSKVESSSSFNIFSIDSSLINSIDLIKSNIDYNYTYSTFNMKDNNYEVNINHIGNDITSRITNHGINTDNNKLSFIINTIVPKNAVRINTNQDSKIIVLKDNNASIKPNLIIDNDDIEANHSAYIGRFKEEELFYLMSRGIKKEDAIDLMMRAFLLGNLSINDEEKELILDNMNKYWR